MKNSKDKNRVIICGIEIDNISMSETIDAITASVDKKENIFVVTPNVDHIVKLRHDKNFLEAYKNASLIVTDGMPILWAAMFLGRPLKEKVSGSDLFLKLCEVASRKGYRLFFLGGREGAAVGASEALKRRYPDIQIAGMYSPPFGFENNPEENNKISGMIRSSRPHILFVGLSAPKQEEWIFRHYRELGVPVSIGVGVTFEFVSGIIKRAPRWMQKAGLEWFWRLMMEPKRLWKRYLIDDMEFFWLILKQKIRRRP